MSAFAEKRALKAQIASAKKAGKSTQTIGRLQYKLNQLTKDSKGTPVKTKSGVLKSKTGIVRQTDASKKKRVVAKRKKPLEGHPNGGRPIAKVTPKAAPKAAPKTTTTKNVVNNGSPHHGKNAGTTNPNLGGSVVRKRNEPIKKKGPDFYKEAVALGKNKATRAKSTGSPHAKITKSASPSSGKSPKYSFSSADDFTKVPRIKGTLPPVADRTKREQIEAYRRRFTK